ncbi:MAG: hypothetical protein ACI4N3_01540 [Alphaproteobacteria bacterium]
MTNFLTYILILLFTFTSSVNACYIQHHDKDTHDIYLNDLYINGNTEKGLGVFGHEVGHAIYGSNEDFAKYLGNNFIGAYTDSLWINGKDTSLGNWSVDNNSSYVIGNTIDWSRVENKDNFEPISMAITALVIAGEVYSIQDSARKIYAWIKGKGYKGKTEYKDPIVDGKIYTAGGNIKEGATDLIIGGGLYVGGKAVSKVGSKLMSKVDDALDIDHISGIGTDLKYLGEAEKVAKPLPKTGTHEIVGVINNPISIQSGTNKPTTILDRYYTGHALDQMQGRGLSPSVVENTISSGTKEINSSATKIYYYDKINKVNVVTNNEGSVITVIPGRKITNLK